MKKLLFVLLLIPALCFGQSRDYNGTTSFTDLGSPTALDNVGGSPGTKSVCAWIYPEGWGETSFGIVWYKANTAQTTGWSLNVHNGGATQTFRLAINGSTSGVSYATSNTLSLNNLFFICGTYKPSDGGPRLFVGNRSTAMAETGYAVARVDVSSYGSDAADGAAIGNRSLLDITFDGRIAELSVWDGDLQVGAMEILRQYCRASQWAFSTSGGTLINLKGYWPLKEASGSITDHSGSGTGGTDANASTAEGPPC